MPENSSKDHYKRVTEILYPFSGLDKIDADIVAKAGERGTKVHKICEAIVLGLGELGVDDQTRPYVESFKQWWEIGHKVLLMEQRFWDDELKITGQVDFILDTPDGLAIADLKTSYKESPTWKAQGCAYAYLAKKANHPIKRIFFIHLSKFGKFPTIYEYPVDDDFFLGILKIWEHFFKDTHEK